MDNTFNNYFCDDRSLVSYLKREIHTQVAREKFSEQRAGEIDIVVSELTSNLVKHAGGGEILYRLNDVDDVSVFEILSIDKGPGMDLVRMMKDGVSTTGTLGHGLGAIERLSDTCQMYSIPGWGTITYATIRSQPSPYVKKLPMEIDVRGLCVKKPRENVCGDGYAVVRTENSVRILFADGLGHGEHAKAAVDKAVTLFRGCLDPDPVEVLRFLHDGSRRSRGLVATVAIMDNKNLNMRICGVGNINTRIYTGIQFKNYLPYNGTVGLNVPGSMKSSEYDLEKNLQLMMCSDGIRSRWELNRYHTIFKYDPLILAACLYKDFSRGNDDASVLIAKVN